VLAACVAGLAALAALNFLVIQPPEAGKAGCKGLRCTAERYSALVKRDSAARAMRAFEADYQRDATVRAECHDLTHVIGRAAGKRYRDVARAYRDGDRFCGSGYFHGVVEELVKESGGRLAPDGVCAELRARKPRSVDHFNCAHGLGHGFMRVRGDAVRASLRDCDRLRTGFERDNCWAGVFMQNVMNEDSGEAEMLDPDRPLSICEQLPARYGEACLERQVLYALERSGGDFRGVFGLCARTSAGSRTECIRRVGGAAAELNLSSRPHVAAQARGTAQLCRLAADAATARRCAEGAVGQFVYYYDGTAEALALCRALGIRGCAQSAKRLFERQRRGG
jgi:hypothetical protein